MSLNLGMGMVWQWKLSRFSSQVQTSLTLAYISIIATEWNPLDHLLTPNMDARVKISFIKKNSFSVLSIIDWHSYLRERR